MINPAELELLRDALATLSKGYEKLPEFTLTRTIIRNTPARCSNRHMRSRV
jgi:hypothetical protein